MEKIFADTKVGRKNIGLGIVQFLILGVLAGIPLTVDLFGGSWLTSEQYQTWKVLHAYAVFGAFVNFFLGYCIDRVKLSNREKEISSWSFAIAGLVGGFGRAALFMLAMWYAPYSYAASLIETVGFVLGTFVFVRGLLNEQR